MALELVIERNTTSYKRCGIVLRDATTGKAKSGLVAADLTARSERGNAASASISLSDLATFTSAYSSGGIKEDGATGQYRLDLPDAVLATGSDSARDATVVIEGSAILPFILHIALVDFAPDTVDKTDFALTSDYDTAKTAAQAGDAMTLTSDYDAALTAAQAGDAMALTSTYDHLKLTGGGGLVVP